MVRLSKQTRKRSVSYKRPKVSGAKTAQNNTQNVYKVHANALNADTGLSAYIPKVG